MSPFGLIASTSTFTVALLGAVLWIFKNTLVEGIKAAIKAEYDEKLERLRADLRRESELALALQRAQSERETSEALAHLGNELSLLKDKELGGHRDKQQIYRLVIDVLAELYEDIAVALSADDLRPVTDRYNRGWIRCYGYLSMLAPQDVMDAFDAINDYILQLLSGRTSRQPWSQTRGLALAMVNAIRRDVGIDESPIEYHGSL